MRSKALSTVVDSGSLWSATTPWVDLSDPEPAGVEPELVRDFAEQIDAEVEWVAGRSHELAGAMRGFQLDLIVGGLDPAVGLRREVAMTRPYVDTEVEIGVPPGPELPDALGGQRIWVERNSEAAALLEAGGGGRDPGRLRRPLSGATVRPFSTPTRSTRSATGARLHPSRRRARDGTPMGENAFLLKLKTSCSIVARRPRICCTPGRAPAGTRGGADEVSATQASCREDSGQCSAARCRHRADQHRLLDQPDRASLLRLGRRRR